MFTLLQIFYYVFFENALVLGKVQSIEFNLI